MIAAFLIPYPVRGVRAPYLWSYYRLLAAFEEQVLFICGSDYLRSPSEWISEERWEVSEGACSNLGYTLPNDASISRHRYFELDNGLFDELLRASKGSPTEVFRRLLSERISTLEGVFDQALSGAEEIEAVLTFCNCPSLEAIAAARNIPVVHMELGPLRAPIYQRTAYFDFSGVNGNTEARSRYLSSDWRPDPELSIDKLRALFQCAHTPVSDHVERFKVGVVLQVEDDSNLIAYGDGNSNLDLITRAAIDYGPSNVLIREHPGSAFNLRSGRFVLDRSGTSTEFIQRCERVLTINSSVGLEAILHDIPVTALGESSYRFICEMQDREEITNRLAHYLLAYLVPMKMVFDPAYLRFRLAAPSDSEIVIKHLVMYFDELAMGCTEKDEQIRSLELTLKERDATAENFLRAVEDRDRQIESLESSLDERQARIDDLVRAADDRGRYIEHLEESLTERDARWVDLSSVVENRDRQIANLEQIMTDRDRLISSLEHTVAERTDELFGLRVTVSELEERIRLLTVALTEREDAMSSVLRSKSWRITHPLRVTMTTAGRLRSGIGRARNALRYIARGDFHGLKNRVRAIRLDRAVHEAVVKGGASESLRFGVMATPHTLFIAHLVASRLRNHNFSVELMLNSPNIFDLDFYIVICPQMFSSLPPGERRIVFQMEQSVSSRWFTNEYLDLLNNSLCVLEYALVNVEFLHEKGIAYPHVSYLPVGADPHYMSFKPDVQKTYDVLFYGDASSSPRRRELLRELEKHFKVRTCSEVFGEEMIDEIRRARVVVNIHYYEDALLEMPRIQECLSLGVPVVSECARDQEDYPELHGAVRYFRQGDASAMIDAIRSALEKPVGSDVILAAAIRGAKRFDFMFDRFLVAMNILPSSKLSDVELPLRKDASLIALSMPETIVRRRIFQENRPDGCEIFDGVRYRPGWVGCGLSYSSLARNALRNGIERLTVLEDDVLLPDDFEEKMRVVNEYLDNMEGGWDVFAAVIAVLHENAKVVRVENHKGICFVTIDKMTSMVCNIYSKAALRMLAAWDPEHRDDQTNTIDKYIERQKNLRVVVAMPFLVGHREEVTSTLWGFQNTQYRDLIAGSARALDAKVRAFLGVGEEAA